MVQRSPNDYDALSNQLKLLAHPERLRILDAIRRDAECVCHLEALLNKPQPYVSQQLRILRDAGVIRDEKDGQNVFYRLIDTQLATWLALILEPLPAPSRGVHSHAIVNDCPCPKCTHLQNAGNTEDEMAVV